MTSNDFTDLSESPFDRRTLIKAGVWAAPVVVLATASPATASSTAVDATLTVSGATGNKHNALLKLDGPVGTEVKITVTSNDVNWSPAFPASITIGTGGTASFNAVANATGKTAGSFSLGMSANVSVTPASFTNVPVPVKS